VPVQPGGAMDGFLLAYDGFDPGSEGLREALTSTGNGYLCTRGAVEWEEADGVYYPGTYVHGGYNRETTILGGLPVLNEDLVNLPNWLVLQLRVEGGDAINGYTDSIHAPVSLFSERTTKSPACAPSAASASLRNSSTSATTSPRTS
jgi:trehalose/maltose hydrolase-like predicted phosphorylase